MGLTDCWITVKVLSGIIGIKTNLDLSFILGQDLGLIWIWVCLYSYLEDRIFRLIRPG